MKRLWFWMFLTLALAAQVQAGAENFIIEIPENITVAGPKIFLSDLGQIHGGNVEFREYLKKVDLGLAPLPGQVRILSKEYLGLLIQQYKARQMPILKMSNRVTVKVEATCIKAEDLNQAIQKIVAAKQSKPIKKWVELRNLPSEIWVSKGDWQINVKTIGNLPEVGAVLFKVSLVKEKENRTLNVSGRIRAIANVYRTIREIPVHSKVTPADFERIEIELISGREFLGEIEADTRTTKNMKYGEVLRDEHIQTIPAVEKGHEVKVIVTDEQLVIQITAIAAEDGWLGDKISIINPISRKAFHGQVIGSGKVEVNL